MDEKTTRALVEAGAVKKVLIIGDGAAVHVNVVTCNDTHIVTTTKGAIKTWATLDSSARWVKGIGIGKVQLEISKWLPGQRGMAL